MKEVKLLNNHRKILWDETKNCEHSIGHVAGLFQNEMPLNEKMIKEWSNEIDKVVGTLNTIKVTMQCWIKEQ